MPDQDTLSEMIKQQSSVGLLDREPENDPDRCAHIVKSKDGKSGVALTMEARLMGFEVEALCGHRFVPTKDAKTLPVCQTCKEIYELYGIEIVGGFDSLPEQ